jgi:class 3 adenylate cyclase/tetratricopeptide (TPR) repeat protein
MSKEAERRLTTILAADVVGYSRLMGEDHERTLRALRDLRAESFGRRLEHYRGRVVKSMGDGWLVEFSSIGEAVECAIAIQQDLQDHDFIELRVGVHVGDVTFIDEDLFGDGVNISARLQEVAPPRGILISDDVRRQIDGARKAEFAVVGDLRLKNIIEPVTVSVWPASEVERFDAAGDGKTIGKPKVGVGDFSQSGTDQPIADGIRDDLMAILSKQSGVEYVADEKSADYLLSGAVRCLGSRARISAGLANRASGAPIWSGRYELDLSDPFAVQDDCVFRISSAVRFALWDEEARRVALKPIEELEPDELLALGSFHIHKQSVRSLLEAAQVLHGILENDPENFMANAMSAMAKLGAYFYGYGEPSDELRKQAVGNANRAVQANGASDYSYFVLSWVDYFVVGDLEGAVLAARRALEINPNFNFAYAPLAAALVAKGDYQGGLEAADRCLATEPTNPFYHIFLLTKGVGQMAFGRYEQAVREIARADKQFPGSPRNLMNLTAAHWLAGQHQQSRDTADKLKSIAPEFRIGGVWLPPFKDQSLTDMIHNALVHADLPE